MSAAQFTPSDPLWRPATLLRRGVAAPFTTPSLAGARVRGGQREMELVVPHPAGSCGFFILAWAEAAEACSLTVHDTLLLTKLAAQPGFAPRSVRHAARAVLSEGIAGRPARAAAHAAALRDGQHVASATSHLLHMLAAQTEGAGATAPDAATDTADPDPVQLTLRAQAAIRRVAATFECPAARIVDAIAVLAPIYAGIGLGPPHGQAVCATTMASVRRLSSEIAALIGVNGGVIDLTATVIAALAETTLLLAQTALAQAIERARDMPGLLRAMTTGTASRAAVLQALERAEWLLDGWEQIGLLWRVAVAAGTWREALAEIAFIVPVFPAEVETWGDIVADNGERRHLRHSAAGFDAARGGAATFELIARNERLRALAA